MLSDALVKNTAGEEEIIQFLHLVNLRGCSANASFKGETAGTHRARDPPRSSPAQQKGRPHLNPSWLPQAAPALWPQQQELCLWHPSHSKLTPSPHSYWVAFFWLQTVGKRQQTGLCNYIAPCLLFYSENYTLFPLLICGHRGELLADHFQSWPASAQYWWLPWQIISFCYAFKLSYIEFITSCDGDWLGCFKGFSQC